MSGRFSPRRRGAPHLRQRGFSLIAVIFMIVVLAALGAFAVNISLSQQQTGNLAVLEARAAAAAQAGIEYEAYMVRAAPSNCVTNTLTLSGGALAGFKVTVTCIQGTHPVTAGTDYSYALSASASTGVYGTPDFVARQATLTVTSP